MINRQILRLALPAIISNITTPLLGLVDTAITGHLGAAVYLAAIAVGSTMFSMLYWLMAFLRMGSSGLTAQAYGADDLPRAFAILSSSIRVAAIASVIMIVLSPWLADVLLLLVDADVDTALLARTYFLIVVWGAPAVLGSYALTGWLLGMQDSKSPMWMSVLTNVVNILVSLILVFGFHLKIEGVAIGTISAQWLGFGLGIIFYRRYRRRLPSSIVKPNKGLIKSLFKVNMDIFLRTLCLVAVTVWFTRSGARLGTDVLAANALLMQLFILFSYFMDGFAFAGEALSGRYFGASDRRNLVLAIRGVFLCGLGVAVLFTGVYLVGGEWILHILTDDFDVVESAKTYLPWAIAVPFAGVWAFAWDGVFIGLTLTRQMLWSMVLAMIVYFLLYFIITPVYGNHGLWLAFIAYLITRGGVQTAIFIRRENI